ncbi:hypothetical protein GCM10010399_02750 [Dactylosporangium fulvum]
MVRPAQHPAPDLSDIPGYVSTRAVDLDRFRPWPPKSIKVNETGGAGPPNAHDRTDDTRWGAERARIAWIESGGYRGNALASSALALFSGPRRTVDLPSPRAPGRAVAAVETNDRLVGHSRPRPGGPNG